LRYERAGVESDGQYPPSPKLAKLCFELDISPLKALLACLPPDDYWKYYFETAEDPQTDHPMFDFLGDQFAQLASDNRTLRVLLERMIQDPPPAPDSAEAEMLEHLKKEARKIFNAQKRFEDAAHMMFSEKKLEMQGFGIPGGPNPGEPDDWRREHDYAAIRNDPDHEGPGRSSQNPSEAVGAASDHPKQEDDQT
jgi:hypothetical protein